MDYLCFAEALDIGTIYNVSMLLLIKWHFILTKPLSITYLIPQIVIEVSAILVAITTFLSLLQSTG